MWWPSTSSRAYRFVGGGLVLCLATEGHASPPAAPWERTEAREPCASFETYRQPFFGDTHVHTAYSSDAVFAGTRDDPRSAYRFARGEAIGLPPFDAKGRPTRTARLRRPLDFTAVTDHAEQFGEIYVCLTPGLPGHDSPDCIAARNQLATPVPPLPNLLPPVPVINFLLGYGAQNPPARFSWCGERNEHCLGPASLVWDDTRSAAEEFYDRTRACRLTTFVAYEWSAQPGGNNLHRNVIFRNDRVPSLPTSYMQEQTPEGLWAALRAQCIEGLPGCDALTIPHNPNASGGLMFAPRGADGGPLTAAAAAARAEIEPVVEMTQHKGDSECRPGAQSTDEICGYEKLNRLQLFSPVSDPNQTFPPLNYVRNALKEGLVQDEALGVNPFRLGLIGSTDTHNATPGSTEEADFGAAGHIGLRDGARPAFPLQRVVPAGIEANPGGLAVVWAEENSRDAIFAAIRRREVYATSGTRPVLRFFAGDGSDLRCGDPKLVEKAYRSGVPMGSEIGPVRGTASPRFTVLAFRDPGASPPSSSTRRKLGRIAARSAMAPADATADPAVDSTHDPATTSGNDGGGRRHTAIVPPPRPPADPASDGTPLQRVQIVKGWVDASGAAREKVYEVAGDPENGADVDPQTCTRRGRGFDSLCAVWVDPDFDASERAFYYARVLENPTCRWSTHYCNDLGIDCRNPAAVPSEYSECCNPEVPKSIQERAWSSPIWYRPEGVTEISGRIELGERPALDRLDLSITLGALPAGMDVAGSGFEIVLRDSDVEYRASIPAGALREVSPGHLASEAELRGALAGFETASVRTDTGGRASLHLRSSPVAFSAGRSDHFMDLRLRSGHLEVSTTVLWRLRNGALVVSR